MVRKRALALFLLIVSTLCAAQRDSPAEWRERDDWQRPQEVLDALEVRPGQSVADVGAGRGYFSLKLAERLGPTGTVYAVDVDASTLKRLKRSAATRNLSNVRVVVSSDRDPKLPERQLDTVLVVNAYHEFRDHRAMLAGLLRALKPGGKLAIIDAVSEAEDDRASYHQSHGLPSSVVRQEATAAGFEYVEERPGFVDPRWGRQRQWYFLIFRKPAAAGAEAN